MEDLDYLVDHFAVFCGWTIHIFRCTVPISFLIIAMLGFEFFASRRLVCTFWGCTFPPREGGPCVRIRFDQRLKFETLTRLTPDA